MKKQNATAVEMKEVRDFPEQIQEKIRKRAYELYELRGREDGHEWDDWLMAESEVAAELAK